MNSKNFMTLITGVFLAPLCLVAVSLPSPLIPLPCLYAAFNDRDWGARPIAMGYAYTALADDSNGQLFNPAGTVRALLLALYHASVATGGPPNASFGAGRNSERKFSCTAHPR